MLAAAYAINATCDSDLGHDAVYEPSRLPFWLTFASFTLCSYSTQLGPAVAQSLVDPATIEDSVR